MTELLSVDRALAQILLRVAQLPAETISIEQAPGRILAEDVSAEIDLPPFPNSSMDGYAVRSADVTGASKANPVRLQVVMDIPAGVAPERPVGRSEAARIMTGAPLPEGADAIVPVEETDSERFGGAGTVAPKQVLVYRGVKAGDYVRLAGENIRAGEKVLAAGSVIRPQEIGVLAALGIAQLPVVRRPRMAIISTGDELLELDAPLTPGKIRDSNSYMLVALAGACGAETLRLPIAPDTLEAVRGCFQQALEWRPDVIVSSAGVSVGTFDVVRVVLAELGQVDFWRVNLRPGKPLAYGQIQGVPFFGLPGNPVSVMVTFDLFVRPALLKLGGRPDRAPMTTAVTGEEIASDGRRSYIRVRLEREDGRLVAYPTGTQSSGALMSMVLADGLLIIPEDASTVARGAELQVRLLRDDIA